MVAAALGLLLAATGLRAESISRIGWGSCLHQEADQTAIWEAVVEADPELFILAGDNVYADTRDRAEFRGAYEQLLAQGGFQRLRQHLAGKGPGQRLLAVWDDHDFGENDAGREYPLKDFAQQLLLKSFGEPETSPRWDREGLYGSWYYGNPGRRIQVILLDTRYHRTPLQRYPAEPDGKLGAYKPNRDDEATFLGEAQWNWLEEELQKPAQLRLLVSSIQVLASEHRWEKWANLPGERRRLLRLIEDSGAEGILFLSGDRHHAELSRVVRGVPYPLYDFTASGMTQSNPWRNGRPERPEPNRYRVGSVQRGHHFGMVEVDWKRADPVIHLRIVGKDGRDLLRHRILLSELSRGTEAVDSPQWRYADGQETRADWFLDGRVADWAEGEYLRVEDGHLLARMEVARTAGLPYTGETLYWGVDTDNRAQTGRELRVGDGMEAAIAMNRPRVEEPRYGNDRALRWNGAREVRDLRDFGFLLGPTYASRVFEFAFPLQAVADWLDWQPGETLRFVGGRIDHDSAAARVLWEDEVRYAAADAAVPPTQLPAPVDGGLRVVSWNVLWGGPAETPMPYARILRALDADLLLLQEWTRETVNAVEVENWFNRHLAKDKTRYRAIPGGAPGWWNGTVLVTPHPVEAGLPTWNPLEAAGWDFPQRLAGGMVQTPVGRILAASIHYKSAGGEPGSREDARRSAEAAAANALLRGAAALGQPDGVVLGGDFNLIGQRRVLQKSMRHLDLDESPLAVAQAGQLGRSGVMDTYTGYSPGSRLDYIGFADSRWQLKRAFVLNSELLDADTLQEAGLQRGDSTTSDHLPVVIDLLPLR